MIPCNNGVSNESNGMDGHNGKDNSGDPPYKRPYYIPLKGYCYTHINNALPTLLFIDTVSRGRRKELASQKE